MRKVNFLKKVVTFVITIIIMHVIMYLAIHIKRFVVNVVVYVVKLPVIKYKCFTLFFSLFKIHPSFRYIV